MNQSPPTNPPLKFHPKLFIQCLANRPILACWNVWHSSAFIIRLYIIYLMSYPESDSPWTFYFNGIAMPKWGWYWPAIGLDSFKDPQKTWDRDIGPRDIYFLECRIDHVGTIESADPNIFRYAVQEILCILLDKREAVLDKLGCVSDFSASPDEIYHDLVEASLQMRELVIRDGRAFWTRGYEPDCLRLIEAIRCASLSLDSPDYAPPPHIQSLLSQLASLYRDQAKTLHRVASSGGLTKEMRKRLLDVSTV